MGSGYSSLVHLQPKPNTKFQPMFISTMTHFLDEEGNIPKEMPKEGREMAGLLALIVDAATKDYPPRSKSTDIRCIMKKCTGTIELFFDDEIIEWWCTDCNEAGRISDWQGSKWDNRKQTFKSH
jgi:hypothetical protein